MRQMLNCKDINNKVMDIFKSTSKVFNTSVSEVQTGGQKSASLKLKGHIIRLCTLQTDLVRPKVRQKFICSDMSVIR